MSVSYDNILDEIIANATIANKFNIESLQEMQDEFAYSFNIASVITDVNGNPVTVPSNFTTLCADYVRKSKVGFKQCKCSDSIIGNVENNCYSISKCLSAGLVDGGVGFYIGKHHVGNWMFGQVLYPDRVLSDEEIISKALAINIDPEVFEREYKKVHVMTQDQFLHVAHFAAIIAKKFSDEAYAKCEIEAQNRYKVEIENDIKKEKERLEYENSFDFLTKFFTRNSFEAEIRKLEVLQTIPVAIIVCDVNNLKLTNDIFGHKFGDQLIEEVTKIMNFESYDGYILGRCGGDEFNVLIPNGNRQAAEYFCYRVGLELNKNYNCCVLPSVAFGVGKKDHIQERIKDLIEIADQKMYRNKIQIKQKETFLDNVKKALIGKKRLSDELLLLTKQMTIAYADFLQFDLYKKDMFVRLTEMHNMGVGILDEELYAKRFETKLAILDIREMDKVPVINSKLAALYPEYAVVSSFLQNYYENFNGTGYPNGLSGNEIPEIVRYSRVLTDYIYFQQQIPVGLGKDAKSSMKLIAKGSGKIYDPMCVNSLQKFVATL